MTRGDWEQFEDWCAATGHVALPTTWQTVQSYLEAAPVAALTRTRRLGAIRARHEHARAELVDAPTRQAPPKPWRPPGELVDPTADEENGAGAAGDAPRWLDLGEALHHLPVHGFPHGVTVRRDALVLVLAARGWSRRQITGLTVDQIRTEPVPAIDNTDLPMTNHGLTCPSCALTRWLRVLAAVYAELDGEWEPVADVVDRAPADVRAHDCARPIPSGWTRTRHILPVIDRAGRVDIGTVIPTRRVSAIISSRQRPPQAIAFHDGDGLATVQPRPAGWRPPTPADRAKQLHDIDKALDNLDDAIGAADQRFARIMWTIDHPT